MGANMRCEKNSLALLSSKRTKAFSKCRADEAFALPSFSDVAPAFTVDSSYRSGREPKVEHHVNDVEKLKQTMLQHESMFKEQLYELHRLYQVQRLLMEESKRKSLASHPHLDSPSSNSSLLYNQDPCRPKEEGRFWEANDASKIAASQQLSFFSGQIDVNKPQEDEHYADRLVNASRRKDSQRPIIDLELPAEEHTEIELEDEKTIVRNSFFHPVGNPQVSHANRQDSQCSSLSRKSVDMTMHEEKSNSICRELPSSSKWRSFEDCFTPEYSKKKEVPYFPLGSSNSKNCLVDEPNLPSSQRTPATSLFGVNLKQEIGNIHVRSPVMHSNVDHKMREPQFAGSDACDRSTGQTSKLPHWLVQGLQTTSATQSSSINSVHQRQHQTSPFFLQKQGERMLSFDERASSISAQQELSESWAKSGGRFSFGDTFLRAPQCKYSSGYYLDASTGNVQGFHKLVQASSVNDSIPLVSPLSIDRRVGVSPMSATNHASSPFIIKHSSVSEMDAAPALLFKELSSKGKNNGSPVPPWYQQRAPSPVMPQFPKAGAQNQRLSSAFSVNSSSSCVNVPAHDQVQEGIFTKGTLGSSEGNLRSISGSVHSLLTRPEVSAKRLIFGFMPTASDLDLTLGLDLNDNEDVERMKRMEDLNDNVTQGHDKTGLRSESIRNDFDLNEQSGQIMDAESRTFLTSSKHEFEACTGLGCGMATTVKAPYFEEWKTSHKSSSLKVIPTGETTAGTATPRQESVTSFLKMDRHGDTPDDEQPLVIRVNGGSFMAGRSSEGSGLTIASCESRSTPIPALSKARDDSTLSGEACQHIAVGQLPQEVLFKDGSMALGRKQGVCSAMLGCSEVYQREIAEESLKAKYTFKDNHATGKTSQHKTEAFEAADILLLLSVDVPSMVVEDQDADGDQERALKCLADIIPEGDMSDIDGAGLILRESTLGGSEHHLDHGTAQEKLSDSFEFSVLSLKPINPDSETICTQSIERLDVAEEGLPPPNLRRRPLRRGRAGKDFQKEMLPSIASLSRQEVTEDLQIIEGLVKSATEAMARCSLSSKEDASWSLPALSSAKTPGKAKGFRSCKAGKQNGLLRVCSWGESTRRRRMRRQRRVCLPLGV